MTADEKLDLILTRLDVIDIRLDGIDTRLDRMHNRLDKFEKLAWSIKTDMQEQFAQVHARLSQMEQAHLQRLKRLETAVFGD